MEVMEPKAKETSVAAKGCKKPRRTLFQMFLRQVIGLSLELFVLIAGVLLFFAGGLTWGYLRPANYYEKLLEQRKQELSETTGDISEWIPERCTYGIYTLEYTYVAGTLSDGTNAKVKKMLQGMDYSNQIMIVERTTDYVAVSFPEYATFESDTLYAWIPNVDIFTAVVFLSLFVLIVITNTISFDKKLKRELIPLQNEIEQVQMQKLGPSAFHSDVKEIHEMMRTLEQVKSALAASLRTQWETEQRRRDTISALAHDVKSPLTVIKGHMELIQEEDDIEEILEEAGIVLKHVEQIERYMELLMQVSRDGEIKQQPKRVTREQLRQRIVQQSMELCKAKNVELTIQEQMEAGASGEEYVVDQELLLRAVLNILGNACDYTGENRVILTLAMDRDHRLHVQVEDFGTGFSKEALVQAKEQFYTERKERQKEHYGLGLYMAGKVAELYRGNLTIQNKENETGAIVEITIKVC